MRYAPWITVTIGLLVAGTVVAVPAQGSPSGPASPAPFAAPGHGIFIKTDQPTIWTSENDGEGSGLDADLLDGNDSTDFWSKEAQTLESLKARDSCDVGDVAKIINGIIDCRPDLIDGGNAETLDGLDSSDFLDKATYDGDADGLVDEAEDADTLDGNDSTAFWSKEAQTLESLKARDSCDVGDVAKIVNGIIDCRPDEIDGGNADLLDGNDSAAFLDVATYDGDADGLVDDADQLDGLDSSEFARAGHLHDDRYYTESESDDRFINVGETASDSDALDGLDSSEFLDKATYDGDGDGSVDQAEDADLLDGNDSTAFWSKEAQTLESLRAQDSCDVGDVAKIVNGIFDCRVDAVDGGNADTLDGLDSSDFLDKATYDGDDDGIVDQAEQAGDSDTLDGKDSSVFLDKATYDGDGDGSVDQAEQAGDSDTLDGLDSSDFPTNVQIHRSATTDTLESSSGVLVLEKFTVSKQRDVTTFFCRYRPSLETWENTPEFVGARFVDSSGNLADSMEQTFPGQSSSTVSPTFQGIFTRLDDGAYTVQLYLRDADGTNFAVTTNPGGSASTLRCHEAAATSV